MTETKYQNPPVRSIENLHSTCHFIQLAKIPGMERISKPPFPMQIYTVWQNR